MNWRLLEVRLIALLTAVCALFIGGSSRAASVPGDVVGKVTVGYQGWFACPGDGAPINSWWHYSGTYQPPTYNTLTNHIHAWPDMRQFVKCFQTGFTNFGNGQPATLFSSYDDQVVQTHFRWMSENGIDAAALQRFDPTGGEGPTRNGMALKVKQAAEMYHVKFYIMYDITGWTSFQDEIKNDWTNMICAQLQVTNSTMYAMQNGKPVVCIWGMGFSDNARPFDTNQCMDVVNWFKAQGCYLIGGAPTHWRTESDDSRPGFLPVYSAFDMISPWMVGRIGNSGDTDNYYNNVNLQDQAYCNSHGIDYQPCVLPGDTGQRAHGDFMWRQFYNMKRLGCQAIYISMFDEFNEGNQIACTAEDVSMVPMNATNLYFTLDQDGTHCSSDYYLRLTGDGGKMLKGTIALTSKRPTQPMLPIVIPPAPTNVLASSGNSQISLQWTYASGAARYFVKRALSSDGPFTVLSTNVGCLAFNDSGVTNGTTYYYKVTAVNSAGESVDSAVVSATPIAFYQVNSGGSGASPFVADMCYSGGTSGSTSSAIDTTGVINPAPQAVYQTERWGNSTYGFTNLTPGALYRVRLHFAEIYYSTVGTRRFNVSINGSRVLSNYDILADVHAKNKATVKDFAGTATAQGQIVIQFINISGADNAKSSGIEILPLISPQLNFGMNNGALQINWPVDRTGWRLLETTNGLSGSWFVVPGSTVTNQILAPLGPDLSNAFFRLVYP